MLQDSELLTLNIQGFIPGPEETESSFIKRVNLTKELFEDPKFFFEERGKTPPFQLKDKLLNPDRQWAKSSLLNCFGISAAFFSAYFSDEKLKVFQGAATWIINIEDISLPILQLRKSLKKGRFLKIYELEDILAHELSHFARAGFNQPKFEEFFAYFTSSGFVRKYFGPLAISSTETFLFLLFILISLGNQYLGILFSQKIFDILFLVFGYLASKMIFLGFVRLGYRRWIFARCFKKLFSLFKTKEKALSVMFRLTDKEIKTFSKKESSYILAYAKEMKDNLRWKVLNLAYFQEIL